MLRCMMVATIAFGLATTAAAQDGKPDTLKLGEQVFMVCHVCHTIGKDEGNKVGPNLNGVFGAKAGHRSDFHYSPALEKSGVVWSEESLDKWLTRPMAFIRGTRMSFGGLQNPEQRKAVIAYLKSAGGGH